MCIRDRLYSTADTQSVNAVRTLLGNENADKLIAQCLAEISLALAQAGVRRLIVAGTRTAQACLKGLGVSQLRVGVQVDPGAPWCYARYVPSDVSTAHKQSSAPVEGLHICLKPGRVGDGDFFTRAFSVL